MPREENRALTHGVELPNAVHKVASAMFVLGLLAMAAWPVLNIYARLAAPSTEDLMSPEQARQTAALERAESLLAVQRAGMWLFLTGVVMALPHALLTHRLKVDRDPGRFRFDDEGAPR
jgi:hypothetical protein